MSIPTPPVDTAAPTPAPDGPLSTVWRAIRRRILSGLVAALPVAVTFWIIYWLYTTFQRLILEPMRAGVQALLGQRIVDAPPWWWDRFVAPILAIFAVLLLLYILGLLVRSRVHRMFDWVLLHVPVVTTIYKTVSNLVETLDPAKGMANQFKRVVLVEFPHPGMRSLAFVTNACRDEATGRTILCVCLLTGVMPPTGFTLFVPEESVTDIDWTVNQTIQAILTGGLTLPPTIGYFPQTESAHREKGAPPAVRTH